MRDDLQQMRHLIVEVENACNQLAFNLSVAVKQSNLSDEFLEDLEFDVHRMEIFARAVRDAWSSFGRV